MTTAAHPPARRPPWVLVAGVALAHAMLLLPPLTRLVSPAIAPPHTPALAQVRTVYAVHLAAPAPTQPVAAAVAQPAATRNAAHAEPRRRKRAARTTAAPRPSTQSVPAALTRPALVAAAPPSASAANTAPAAATPPAAPPEAPAHQASPPPASAAAPTTHTAVAHLPASATLDYHVQARVRGLPFEAEAQLVWRRDAARYQAEWVVRMPMVGQRVQRSEGAVTAAGLAPERYAEHGRGERAAHFDTAGGRIRFSANTPDAPLQAGAQDRLTVSLQLGALIAAAPQRYPAGSQISLQTAGVRDADAWTWDMQQPETLHIDGHEVTTIKLVRQPRKAYDTRVELWLAPELDHLPARLRVTQSGGDVVDQQLKHWPDDRRKGQ